MKSYTTVSMDTWDISSKKVYGDEHYIDKLIAANVQYRKVVIFSAGIVLSVPEVDVSPTSDEGLPAWKRLKHD